MRAILLSLAMIGSASASEAPSARVSVLSTGEVLLNGKRSDLIRLDGEFSRLSKSQGIVWYYREAPTEEPSPQAMSVVEDILDLIDKHRLPLSLSTKPDFSDYLGPDGIPHPREP